jgi:hypothetical protein
LRPCEAWLPVQTRQYIWPGCELKKPGGQAMQLRPCTEKVPVRERGGGGGVEVEDTL